MTRAQWLGYWILIFLTSVVLFWSASAFAATLTWKDNATNESGTRIERATARCNPVPAFTEIGEVGVDVTTFVDGTPQQGRVYCYRVRAWNLRITGEATSIQYSGYSNLAEYEFPLQNPADPSQLVTAP